jgi:tetratricopeptide (TPR) repeat protein
MAANDSSSPRAAAQLQSYLRSVDGLTRAGDMQRAIRVAGEAVALGYEHANLLSLAAYEQMSLGAGDKALALATRARELEPHNLNALNALGLALVALGRAAEALKVYDAALRLAPSTANLHLNKARALESINDVRRARNEYERALALKPGDIDALAHLASMAGARGDVAGARDYAKRALAQNPRNEIALLALVMVDVEEKQYAQALSRLAPLIGRPDLNAVNRAIAHGLKGDALDGLGQTEEAFAAYVASKASMRVVFETSQTSPGESALARVNRLIEYFEVANRRAWCRGEIIPVNSPVMTHVFLLGFPRSGTTLLEKIIDAHPEAETISELDCLIEAAQGLIGSPEAVRRLEELDDAAAARYRQLYWNRAAQHGVAPARRIFVDKMPLNSVLLCVIAKLFPDAKILFATRDPRDVVLSCFRRRFGVNADTYELLNLDDAARFYDRVMHLTQLYRDKLDLAVHELRYECVVTDFVGEARKMCAFLGVAWDDSILDFAKKLGLKDIGTPSAAQVARGIYADGIGQWRRYNAQLEPIFPILAPWVTRFGYEET